MEKDCEIGSDETTDRRLTWMALMKMLPFMQTPLFERSCNKKTFIYKDG